jgi:hypothetical protein
VILSGGLQIELKAATDFNPSYLRDGALKDDVPCIFLGSGERKTNIDRLKSMNQIQFVGLNFLKGIHTWAIGCIIPSTYTKETKNQEEEKPLQGHFRQKQNSRRHRNRKINQELETITNSEKLPHKNRGRQSLLYELEEPKYTLEQVFKNQKASDNVEKIIKHFHNEISFQLKSNRLQWKAKTNIRGISYFCNKRNAFLYADIYQQNVTLKFFTGNKTINGLIKANWRTGGDTLGSAPLKIFDIDSISQAVMFAVEAYKIANNWND